MNDFGSRVTREDKTVRGGKRLLIYWHDMVLPHSRFLLEAFDRLDGVAAILALGPADRPDAAAVFTVTDGARLSLQKTEFVPVRTLRTHRRTSTLREWLRHIREFSPDIVVVLDEALSLNLLFAGMANGFAGHGKVFFYQFENIIKGIGWHAFANAPSLANLLDVLRKSVRYVVLDRLVTPLRRRLVSGGLISYPECVDVVWASGWRPPMRQQWWAINSAAFRRDGPAAATDLDIEFTVGFVGRFVPEKGILDLIDAVARLDGRYGLVLVGDGPLRGGIEARIVAQNLGWRVRIITSQNQLDLAKYYRAMDVVVVPSRSTPEWKEQYGRVIMEAMLCGTPVVGSNSGAISVILGRASLLFPEGDALAMAAAIERACTEPPEPEYLAARSRNCGADDFARAWLALADSLD